MAPHKCGKHDKTCCDEHSERKKKNSCAKKSASSNEERFERVYILDPNYQNVNGASVRVGTQKLIPNQAIPNSQFQTEPYLGSNGAPLVNPTSQMGYGLGPFPLNVLPVPGGYVMPQGNTETRNFLPNENFLGTGAQQSQGTGLNPTQGMIHSPPLNMQGNGQGVQALGIPVCFVTNGNKFESGTSEVGNSNQMERGKNNGNNQNDTLGCSSSKRYYNHDRHFKDRARRRRNRTSSRHNRTYRIPHYLTDSHYYERPPTGELDFSSDSETCSVSSEGNYFDDEHYPYERRPAEVYQMRRINRHSTPSRYVFRRHSKDDEGEYIVRPAARSLPIERTTTIRNTVTELPVKDEPTVSKSERLESGDQLPTIRNELHQHNVETQKRIYDLEKKIDELKACLCPSDNGETSRVKSSLARNQSGSNASVRIQSGSVASVRNQSGSVASDRNPTMVHSSFRNSEKIIQTDSNTLNVEHIALIPVDQFKPCYCNEPNDIYESSEGISTRHQSSRRAQSAGKRNSSSTREESLRDTRRTEGDSLIDIIMTDESRRETRRNQEESIRSSRRDPEESRREISRMPEESKRETSYMLKESRRGTSRMPEESKRETSYISKESRREISRMPEESNRETSYMSKGSRRGTSRMPEESRRETMRSQHESRRDTGRMSEESQRETMRSQHESRRDTGRMSEENQRETMRLQHESRRDTGRMPEESQRETMRSQHESRRDTGRMPEENQRETMRSRHESRRDTGRMPEESQRETMRLQHESRRDTGRLSEENQRETMRSQHESRRDTGRMSEESLMNTMRSQHESRWDTGRISEENQRETGRIPKQSSRNSRRLQESDISYRRTSPEPPKRVCCVTTELDECTHIIECPMNRCKCGGSRTPEIAYESEEESSTSLIYAYTEKEVIPILNDDSIYSDNNNVQNYVLTYYDLSDGLNDLIHFNNSNKICYEDIHHEFFKDGCYTHTNPVSCDYTSGSFQKLNTLLDKNESISSNLVKLSYLNLLKNIVASYFENPTTNSIKACGQTGTYYLNKIVTDFVDSISSESMQKGLENIVENINQENYSKMSEILQTFFKTSYYQKFCPYNPLQNLLKTPISTTAINPVDSLNSFSKRSYRYEDSEEEFKLRWYQTIVDSLDYQKYCTEKSIDFTHPLIDSIVSNKLCAEMEKEDTIKDNDAIIYISEYWYYNSKNQIEYRPTFSCLPLIQEGLDFNKSEPYTRGVPHCVNSQTYCDNWGRPIRTADKSVITERSSISDISRIGNTYNSTSKYLANSEKKCLLDKVLTNNSQRLGVVTQSVPLLNTFILSMPTTTFANESSQTYQNYSYFSRDTSSADTYLLSTNKLSRSSSYTGSSNENVIMNTYHTYTNYRNDSLMSSHSQLCKECGQPLNTVPSSGCRCPFIRECSCPPTNQYYPTQQSFSQPQSSFSIQKTAGVQVRQSVKPQATQYSDIQLTQRTPSRSWPSGQRDVETQCIDCDTAMIIEKRGNETVKRWICKPLEDDVNISSLNPVQYQPPTPQHHSYSQLPPPPQTDFHQPPYRPPSGNLSSSQFVPPPLDERDQSNHQTPSQYHPPEAYSSSIRGHSSLEHQSPSQYWTTPNNSITSQSAKNSRDLSGKHAPIQTESWNPPSMDYAGKPQFLYCEVCGRPHNPANLETQFQVVCKKCICKMSTGERNTIKSRTSLPQGSFTCTETTLDPVLHYNYAWQCESCKHWNTQENIAENKNLYADKFRSSQIKLKCECAVEESFSEPKVHQLYEDKNVVQIERENSMKIISKPPTSNSEIQVKENNASDFLWQCNACGKWNSTNPDKYRDHHEWQCKKCNLSIMHPDFEDATNVEKTRLTFESRNNRVMKCHECHQCNGYWMCKTCKEIGTDASSITVYDSQKNLPDAFEPKGMSLENERERISSVSERRTQTSSTTLDQRRPSRTVFAKDSIRKSSRPSQRESLKSYESRDKPSFFRSSDRQKSSLNFEHKPSGEVLEDRPSSARSKVSSGFINGHEIILVEENPQGKQSKSSGFSLREKSLGGEPHGSIASGRETTKISDSTNRSRISTGYIDGHEVVLVEDVNRPEIQSQIMSPRSTKISDESRIRSTLSNRSKISGYIDGNKIILEDDSRSIDKQSASSARSTKGSDQVRERSTFTRKSRSPKTSSHYSPNRSQFSSEYPVQQGDNVSQLKPGRKAIPRNVFRTRKRSETARPEESIDQTPEVSPRRRSFPNTTFIRKQQKNNESLNSEGVPCDNRMCRCSAGIDFQERSSGATCSLIDNRICKCKRQLEVYRSEEHKNFQFGMLRPSRNVSENRHRHTYQPDNQNKYNEVVVCSSSTPKDNTSIINKTRSMTDREKMFNATETICHCRNILKPCIRRKGPETTSKLHDSRLETQRDSTSFKKSTVDTTKHVDNDSDEISTSGTVAQNSVIHNFNITLPEGVFEHLPCEKKVRSEHNYSESRSSDERQPNIKKRIYLVKKSNNSNRKQERDGQRVDISKENCVKNEKNKKKKINGTKQWNKEKFSNLLVPEILNKIEEANRSSSNSNIEYSLKKVKLRNQKKSIYVLVKRRKKNETENN